MPKPHTYPLLWCWVYLTTTEKHLLLNKHSTQRHSLADRMFLCVKCKTLTCHFYDLSPHDFDINHITQNPKGSILTNKQSRAWVVPMNRIGICTAAILKIANFKPKTYIYKIMAAPNFPESVTPKITYFSKRLQKTTNGTGFIGCFAI